MERISRSLLMSFKHLRMRKNHFPVWWLNFMEWFAPSMASITESVHENELIGKVVEDNMTVKRVTTKYKSGQLTVYLCSPVASTTIGGGGMAALWVWFVLPMVKMATTSLGELVKQELDVSGLSKRVLEGKEREKEEQDDDKLVNNRRQSMLRRMDEGGVVW